MIMFPTRFTTNYVYNDFPVNTYAKPPRLFSSLPSYGMWHMRVFAEHIWVLERVSYTVNKTLTISNTSRTYYKTWTTKEIYVGNKLISKRWIRSNLIAKKCFFYIYYKRKYSRSVTQHSISMVLWLGNQ